MPISTYSELQAAVAGWLNRTDLTARIPEFIAVGEAKFNRKLRTQEQYTTVDFPITAEYMPVPTDWAQTANLEHDSSEGGEIKYVTPQQFIQKRRCHSPSGKPLYYTLEGRRMRFLPAPDTTHAAILQYYKLIPPLSDLAPTNWVLAKHPDLYLSAALLAANTYLRDVEGVSLATAEMADTIASMQQADQGDLTATTPVSRAQPI